MSRGVDRDLDVLHGGRLTAIHPSTCDSSEMRAPASVLRGTGQTL
jgi:hypothetical protein